MYEGRLLQGGGCVRCGLEPEDTAHAVWGCPATQKAWEATDAAIGKRWAAAGLDWSALSWLRRHEQWNWDLGWGLAGMVPRAAARWTAEVSNLGEIGTFALLKETAQTSMGTVDR